MVCCQKWSLSHILCFHSSSSSTAFQGNFTLMLSGLSTSVGENNGADDRYLGECSCCWHKDLYAVKDSVLSRDVCKVVEVGRWGQREREVDSWGQRERDVDRWDRGGGKWTGVTEGEGSGQMGQREREVDRWGQRDREVDRWGQRDVDRWDTGGGKWTRGRKWTVGGKWTSPVLSPPHLSSPVHLPPPLSSPVLSPHSGQVGWRGGDRWERDWWGGGGSEGLALGPASKTHLEWCTLQKRWGWCCIFQNPPQECDCSD